MPDPTELRRALDALDACDATLERLDSRCCEPGRSPRMAAIGATLEQARAGIERLTGDQSAAAPVLASIEDAGGQVGALQVGCCAPNRLPLYADILRELTTARMAVDRSVGLGH